MARIEFRLPDWLKERAIKNLGGRISAFLRKCLLEEFPTHIRIKKLPSIRKTQDRGQAHDFKKE